MCACVCVCVFVFETRPTTRVLISPSDPAIDGVGEHPLSQTQRTPVDDEAFSFFSIHG